MTRREFQQVVQVFQRLVVLFVFRVNQGLGQQQSRVLWVLRGQPVDLADQLGALGVAQLREAIQQHGKVGGPGLALDDFQVRLVEGADLVGVI